MEVVRLEIRIEICAFQQWTIELHRPAEKQETVS